MSMGNLPEVLSQRILEGIISVGRLGLGGWDYTGGCASVEQCAILRLATLEDSQPYDAMYEDNDRNHSKIVPRRVCGHMLKPGLKRKLLFLLRLSIRNSL